jgi:hypothetical protein
MITAMFLAHLVGDYILQWDALALAKSREFKGVFFHCIIITIITWLLALPFSNHIWWQGILFISLTHFLIDVVQLYYKPNIAPLFRFILDQILHFSVILVALWWGGFWEPVWLAGWVTAVSQNQTLLYKLLGYAFITMPAWVIIKFLAYGLIQGGAPNFPEGTNKYIGIIERILIATFVSLGQFILSPLITLPRLALEWPKFAGEERNNVYIVELLASIALATMTGLVLSQL